MHTLKSLIILLPILSLTSIVESEPLLDIAPPSKPSHKWIDELKRRAIKADIPWSLVYRICNQESDMNLMAIGKKGERGPCQMFVKTARPYILVKKRAKDDSYVERALHHPVFGMRIVISHMKWLMCRYSNNEESVAAAWNAGPKVGDYVSEATGNDINKRCRKKLLR